MLETTRLLRDLVRLPSVNPMGRALPEAITLEHRVTAYLEDFFRGLGGMSPSVPAWSRSRRVNTGWRGCAWLTKVMIIPPRNFRLFFENSRTFTVPGG